MGLANFFGFSVASDTDSELPEIFPLSLSSNIFVETDVLSVYSKILTDCVERTQGVPDKYSSLLWDNCLQNNSAQGLISLLAGAMTAKAELFIKFDPALPLISQATPAQASQIKADYLANGKSALGIYVSFKKYSRTDMVKIYSAMEYCTLGALNKMTNLSKAIQFKMKELRGSVSLTDSAVAIQQAKSVANALRNGREVLLDKEDEVFTNSPDIYSIKESITFLDSKKCFYYGLPLSYINGEQTGGIGSTGEGDARAVERGLKQYFISILKPVLEAVFSVQVTYKSSDYRQIGPALEAVKTFELISDELLSQENKKLIVSKLFDVQE